MSRYTATCLFFTLIVFGAISAIATDRHRPSVAIVRSGENYIAFFSDADAARWFHLAMFDAFGWKQWREMPNVVKMVEHSAETLQCHITKRCWAGFGSKIERGMRETGVLVDYVSYPGDCDVYVWIDPWEAPIQ